MPWSTDAVVPVFTFVPSGVGSTVGFRSGLVLVLALSEFEPLVLIKPEMVVIAENELYRVFALLEVTSVSERDTDVELGAVVGLERGEEPERSSRSSSRLMRMLAGRSVFVSLSS